MFHRKKKETENAELSAKKDSPKKMLFSIKKKLAGKSFQNSDIMQDIKRAFQHINPKKAVMTLLFGVFAIYVLTGLYIVNPGEQAVVKRFGKLLPEMTQEGIHYCFPMPIDEVRIVNVEEVRRADIGMSLPEHLHENDKDNDNPQKLQLLTGDENIISSEAIVHYKIKDAAAFLYNVNQNDEKLVRKSVEASLVRAMANMEVDDILSTEKVKLQNAAMQMAQETLDSYDAGIQITAFNIKAVNPPDEVSEAFRDVTAAKEDKETQINDANGYYNSLIPEARGKAGALITEAEGYQTKAVSQAQGDAEKFALMLQEYQNNSQIYSADTTKYRLFLETMEKVLPNVKKYIVDAQNNGIDIRLLDPEMGSSIVGNTATEQVE